MSGRDKRRSPSAPSAFRSRSTTHRIERGEAADVYVAMVDAHTVVCIRMMSGTARYAPEDARDAPTHVGAPHPRTEVNEAGLIADHLAVGDGITTLCQLGACDDLSRHATSSTPETGQPRCPHKICGR